MFTQISCCYNHSIATYNRIMQAAYVHYSLKVRCTASAQTWFDIGLPKVSINME